MQLPIVMTVIGQDRPGLVELLASIVAKHGGNWLESRMCRLGGEFAGILRIHVDSANESALQDELKSLNGQGLTVVAFSSRKLPENRPARLASLELVGQDRPGIVREISRVLAAQAINVEELTTECTSAPMSGETLFRAQARLQLPKSCALPELRQELERIGGNLLVDVAIEELR